MPLWLWIILVLIGASVTAYRKYSEGAAIRRREAELLRQRPADVRQDETRN